MKTLATPKQWLKAGAVMGVALASPMGLAQRGVANDSAISTGTTVVLGVTQLTGIIIANSVSTTVEGASNSTRGTTRATGASEQEKRALAAMAIEDAAQFYATGELTGVLPAAVARVRELIPGAASASDSEIVEALSEAAQSLLESLASDAN
jgi:hypothetical protein